jgi:Lon protease-like protein
MRASAVWFVKSEASFRSGRINSSILVSMFQLPLFVLNTVLLPGMPLPLYIFEERYKLMINDCLRQRIPFGVVMPAGRDPESPARIRPELVGCTAEIVQAQRLEGGRMEILAIGQDRFRIVELHEERPYLIATAELYPLAPALPEQLAGGQTRLRPLLERYLQVMANASDVDLDVSQLPDEPISLAYLAATLLQVPPEKKQLFLTLNEPAALFDALRRSYRQEIALLRWMLRDDGSATDQGNFSKN